MSDKSVRASFSPQRCHFLTLSKKVNIHPRLLVTYCSPSSVLLSTTGPLLGIYRFLRQNRGAFQERWQYYQSHLDWWRWFCLNIVLQTNLTDMLSVPNLHLSGECCICLRQVNIPPFCPESWRFTSTSSQRVVQHTWVSETSAYSTDQQLISHKWESLWNHTLNVMNNSHRNSMTLKEEVNISELFF